MTYPELLLWSVAVVYLGLSGVATIRIYGDELSTALQKVWQLLFVWMLPIIGALVTIQLKRKHLERGEGRYPESQSVGDDFGFPREQGRRESSSTAED